MLKIAQNRRSQLGSCSQLLISEFTVPYASGPYQSAATS
jgi:hypothetical protein